MAEKKPRKSGRLISRRKKNSPVKPRQRFGNLVARMRVATKKGSSGGQKWRCDCDCGYSITIPQWYLVRPQNPKTHCGCKAKEGVNPYPREKGIWHMMHRRCYNPTHTAFKHYGGAETPVQVCDQWNKDVVGADLAWENFIHDMGPAPTKEHTLDRIDPYDNYRPGNCRWADAKEQMNNQKKHWMTPAERVAAKKAEEESND